MIYLVQIDGFEHLKIEVKPAGVLGAAQLLVDGNPAAKGPRWGQMLLPRKDGSQAVATWKNTLLGLDVPALVVDGKSIEIIKPLAWYQYVWGGLPVLLIFMGGASGALCGMLGLMASIRIFRSSLSPILQYVVSLLISLAAVTVYVILAMLLRAALN